MDDVGDELECRKSNANEDYIFIKYSLKNYSSTNETDKSPISSLSQYLERKYLREIKNDPKKIGYLLSKNIILIFVPKYWN